MTYQEKYIKYKNKYLQLQKQFGGRFDNSPDFSIETEKICFEDVRAPHTIPMYNTMMQLFFSIAPKVAKAQDKFINMAKELIKPDDKPTQIETTVIKDTDFKIKICNQDVNYTKPRIRLLYFPSSIIIPCFFTGCFHYVQIFQNAKVLILCFNVGERIIDFENPISKPQFICWLNNLKNIIQESGCEQMLFCGHSNGMSASTIT